MEIDRARADVVAARHRDARLTGPRQQRAEDGDRGAHPPNELVRRLDRGQVRRVDHDAPVLPGDHGAEVLEDLAHREAVQDARNVAQHRTTRREQRRGHQLEGGVLGARDPDGIRRDERRPSRRGGPCEASYRRGRRRPLDVLACSARRRSARSGPRLSRSRSSRARRRRHGRRPQLLEAPLDRVHVDLGLELRVRGEHVHPGGALLGGHVQEPAVRRPPSATRRPPPGSGGARSRAGRAGARAR